MITFLWNKYGLVLVVAAMALSYIGIKELQISSLRHNLAVSEQKLADARATIASQERIIEALEIVAARQTENRRIIADVTETLQTLPSAEVVVPPDLAELWGNGIDRLRHTEGADTSNHRGVITELPAP
jgi:hypothetical protein